MKIINRNTLYIIVFLLFNQLLINTNSYSQDIGIKLLCSPRKDSILLRWAPTNQKTWKLGNNYGYTILRYTVLKGKKLSKDITYIQLNKEPIKPKPISEWQPFGDDKYVAIAGECIFNDQFKGISTNGNPFIAVKKYKNDIHRFSFALYAADQSLKAASLSGLYFADKSVLPNEKYLYKVFIPVSDNNIHIDTATAFTGISEFQPLPKPLNLRAEWDDKKVTLSWDFRYLKHIYNSYIVEKSENQGKTYKPLNENAIIQLADEGVSPELLFKGDTLLNNETKYFYRVKGVSAFGEYGPPSDSVFGQGVRFIQTPPVIIENTVLNNKMVKLIWSYPNDMNRYISGFRIYSSSKPQGKKRKIYESKSPVERTFVDTVPDITNYYLISVFQNNKEKLSSIITYSELIDSFPPVSPKNLIGKIDSSGKVTINWSHNREKDLDGYRVYSSNDPKFEFILETPGVLKDTVFVDTINIKTLTRNIYYKVRAIDVRQNQSEFSDLLTLKRPDVIPPVSPVIKSIFEQNGNLIISWINSLSSDVKFHQIYRKEKDDKVFQLVVNLDKTTDTLATYIDKKVNPGKEYTYYIEAEDNSGLRSKPSKTLAFKTFGNKEKITLKKRELTDKVKLLWNIKSDKKIVKILIYRSIGEASLQLYDNSQTDTYIDTKLSLEKTYEYRIKAIYEDGSSSELSNAVKVKM